MVVKPVKLLVVGQTPPPYGGQAVMMRMFLDGTYKVVSLYHLRMAYSDDMSQIGRFDFKKIRHLFGLVVLTYLRRLKIGPCYLFYPPAGPKPLPIFRDVFYLLCTRWLFQGTIFHYHAAGISERIALFPLPLRVLAKLAYGGAICSIRPSRFNPDDPGALGSRNCFEIPNAAPDNALKMFGPSLGRKREGSLVPRILFVGVLNESKGCLVLLDALRILLERGSRVRADLVGEIENEEIRTAIKGRLLDPSLERCVTLHGRLVGDAKWKMFSDADIFVFPTFFESESFGLVLIEAMQFEIPVVATRWRGVQSVVVEGETGLLAPIRDAEALAEKIACLLRDPELAARMGAAGRSRFLAEYTPEKFWERMEDAIVRSTST